MISINLFYIYPFDGCRNPFRYCGEYFDKETGTIYLRARSYDPSIGRFTQRDSYTGRASDPLSLNLYTYCANNPVLFVDPSGHWPSLGGIIGGIVGGIGGAVVGGLVGGPVGAVIGGVGGAILGGIVGEKISSSFKPIGNGQTSSNSTPSTTPPSSTTQPPTSSTTTQPPSVTTTPPAIAEGRKIAIPELITGRVDGIEKILKPQDSWYAYQGSEEVIDDITGRYKVVVGPRVLDPEYSDEGKLWGEDFDFPISINAVLQNKETSELMTIECITYTGAKAHTYNQYGNIASFDYPSGLVQTGIAYPKSWNATNETPFSRNNIDASSIEFVGRGLNFSPNDYRLLEMYVLD